MPKTPEICPNCGAEVPPRAKSCPECGSSEETGWSDDAAADGLGLPSEDFNYDEFMKREFGGAKEKSGLKWYWMATGAVLIIAFIYMFVLMFR
ncbi:MAG: zinc ribbon domain-containing protein [Verrucomicrobiales bacterium]